MRLHRLELAAFGPFHDRIEVDLDLLAADGLFLLHGDTGAGKTTLLDAVAFALFGRVPGARNEAKRLRCDRADPTTRTFVRLEATLGGHRLEIVRSPAYARRKARGGGMTEEKHKVVLRWLDEPPAGARPDGSSRAEEVGLAVRDLLGMSADQFFQVVLLPQGEFARFLRSDTADREVLLERLFDTGRFGTVEEWFAAARRNSGVRVREGRLHAAQLIARVAEAGGVASCSEDDARSWTADLRDRLADEAAIAADRARPARQRSAESEERLLHARSVSDRLRRRNVLLDRQIQLERSAGQRVAWVRALDRYAQAGPVVAAAASTMRLHQRVDSAQTQMDELRLVAERLVAPSDDVPKTAVDLRSAGALARLEAGALAGYLLQAREQDADQAALDSAQTSRLDCRMQLLEVEQELTTLPAAVLELSARVETARTATEVVGRLTERADVARVVAQAALMVPHRKAATAEAVAAAATAVDEHQRSVDLRQRLVERRILGMAAELAGSLTEGRACAVCGSAHHPAPAATRGPAVTGRQIADAEKRERVAAADRQSAAARAHEAAVALAQTESMASGLDCEQADVAWRQAAAELDQQRQAALDLSPARKLLQDMTSRLQAVQTTRQLLIARDASTSADVDRLTRATAERADRLALASTGFAGVVERRDHLLRLAHSLDALAAATETFDAADVSHSEARTVLVAALEASPFQDLAEAAESAAIDSGALAAQLRSVEDEMHLVTAGLSDPDLSGLAGVAEPDVAAVALLAQEARRTAETATLTAAAALARCEQVAIAATRLGAAWRELEPVLAADAELAALTEVIHGRGQNAKAMSLRTYVLAAKLGQVAMSAGRRLDAMSGGRYTFVPAQDKESKGRSGGLGLDILDAFSGFVRPAKTLSGGESFLASLALALGLADVVAAEAGGRQLDTMFIDEGFGSLDADTLDMVMGTLDELRAGGRVVGLVSHVDELRQRIPSRLRIRRTAAGSELQLSTN